MSRCPEGDALGGVGGVGMESVVGGDEAGDVDEGVGGGKGAGLVGGGLGGAHDAGDLGIRERCWAGVLESMRGGGGWGREQIKGRRS